MPRSPEVSDGTVCFGQRSTLMAGSNMKLDFEDEAGGQAFT